MFKQPKQRVIRQAIINDCIDDILSIDSFDHKTWTNYVVSFAEYYGDDLVKFTTLYVGTSRKAAETAFDKFVMENHNDV